MALDALLSASQAIDQSVARVSLVSGDLFAVWISLNSDEQQALKSALLLTMVSRNCSMMGYASQVVLARSRGTSDDTNMF